MKKLLLVFAVLFFSSGFAVAVDWKKNIDYVNYSTSSCQDGPKEKCLSTSDYKFACDSNVGISQLALKTIAITSGGDALVLAKAGNFSNLKVTWYANKNRCDVTLVATGVVDGTSKRAEYWGRASSFTLNDDGKILVKDVDWNH